MDVIIPSIFYVPVSPLQLTADWLVLCCTLNESVRQCYCCEMKKKNNTMCTQRRTIQLENCCRSKIFSKCFTPTFNFLPGYDVIFYQLNSISFHFPIDMTQQRSKSFGSIERKRKFSFKPLAIISHCSAAKIAMEFLLEWS